MSCIRGYGARRPRPHGRTAPEPRHRARSPPRPGRGAPTVRARPNPPANQAAPAAVAMRQARRAMRHARRAVPAAGRAAHAVGAACPLVRPVVPVGRRAAPRSRGASQAGAACVGCRGRAGWALRRAAGVAGQRARAAVPMRQARRAHAAGLPRLRQLLCAVLVARRAAGVACQGARAVVPTGWARRAVRHTCRAHPAVVAGRGRVRHRASVALPPGGVAVPRAAPFRRSRRGARAVAAVRWPQRLTREGHRVARRGLRWWRGRVTCGVATTWASRVARPLRQVARACVTPWICGTRSAVAVLVARGCVTPCPGGTRSTSGRSARMRHAPQDRTVERGPVMIGQRNR